MAGDTKSTRAGSKAATSKAAGKPAASARTPARSAAGHPGDGTAAEGQAAAGQSAGARVSMQIGNIKPARGAVKKRKRLGIGTGSGHGGTSTRGHKGLKARSGPNIPAWFEGGQMPLQRRLPKRGFTNIFRKEMHIINVGELNGLDISGVINVDSLKKVGRLSGSTTRLKVLGEGELTRPVLVRADLFSKSAIEKIQASGGTVEIIEKPRRPKRFTKKKA